MAHYDRALDEAYRARDFDGIERLKSADKGRYDVEFEKSYQKYLAALDQLSPATPKLSRDEFRGIFDAIEGINYDYQPMTSPNDSDDPIKAWRERGPSLNSLVLAGDALATALEAAQKERDELRLKMRSLVLLKRVLERIQND